MPRTRIARLRARAVARLTTRDPQFLRRVTTDFPFADEAAAQRTVDIATTFLVGYNLIAGGADAPAARDRATEVPRFFRPFYFEGAAMGFGPFALRTGGGLGGFEDFARALSPATVYQNYVGFGWWLGTFYRGRAGRVARVVAELDPRYGLLCYEGIGFRQGFMSGGRRTRPTDIRRGDVPATHVWYQGYGRSLWFVHMGDTAAAARSALRVPEPYVGDCISGLGTGVAFSWLDRAADYARFYQAVPERFRAEFDQGLSFGWEARQLADRELFDASLRCLPAPVVADVDERVGDVHEVRDALVAAGDHTDFYNAWRRGVVRRRRSGKPLFPAR
ncbi:DUF1702 family protein [Asanoa ferruginea]|uniref:DUF1702 family protein n=1 Tax=Asanoa ferruginea TaxID=53367 RepID=UPI0014769842|nr:DUF1702 family protein [Asanoa ferruginea]